MSVAGRFDTGSVIVKRGLISEVLQSGGICDVKPVTVVADTDALIALWSPIGTPTMASVPDNRSRPRPWLAEHCDLVHATWRWRNALLLYLPGQRWSTWVTWSSDWEFLGWYVNLGRFRSGCRGGTSHDDGGRALATLADWTMPTTTFVDVEPLLLVTTASLRMGKRLHPQGQWAAQRFRPNVVIDTEGTDWVEDRWREREIRLGQVLLRGSIPCLRCSMVTRSPPAAINLPCATRFVARARRPSRRWRSRRRRSPETPP